MIFRTEIKLQPNKNTIDHKSHLVLLGSCFSENMEHKFDYFKFDQFTNPFGILFQPKAIEKALVDCVDQKKYGQKDLMQHENIWLSLHHHSKFNQRDAKIVLREINKNIDIGHKALKKATHIIITLGTSWAYRWNKDGSFVANCHKIPQASFSKELLSSEQIEKSLQHMISKVQEINKEVQFIFTVSPVRHLKDGFEENNLSKALLLAAIHKVKNNEQVHYFPSYEIMMDDLRDYRFYNSDLVHPSQEAVDYIWELFKNSWISEQAREIMIEIEEIQRSLLHRAFDPESEAHQKFLVQLKNKMEKLSLIHPEIKFHKKRK
jgi:lysophospholipase L1-like esterase